MSLARSVFTHTFAFFLGLSITWTEMWKAGLEDDPKETLQVRGGPSLQNLKVEPDSAEKESNQNSEEEVHHEAHSAESQETNENSEDATKQPAQTPPEISHRHAGKCMPSTRISREENGDDKPSYIQWTLGRDPLATVRKYSPHMNIPQGVKDLLTRYIRAYENWHTECHALDVGGRDGELKNFFKKCTYAVLERDKPKNPKFRTWTCDIYNCKQVPECSFDIITMRNVMEHLLDPKVAMSNVRNLLRVGGLLLIWSPWAWRYHAQETYGDYYRYSCRALEYLCIAAGLNPVNSWYEHKRVSGYLATGRPDYANGIDVPPDKQNLLLEAYVVCYKPRDGERKMEFEEVGAKPVQKHPRFYLDYAADGSERGD
mmetsp:Transcript_48215/g.90308  ORF Transcript_48215/g.90308 Transcript_48215/m.90308 type:complete len:372 (+) Transcript_48215:40-1155(+)